MHDIGAEGVFRRSHVANMLPDNVGTGERTGFCSLGFRWKCLLLSPKKKNNQKNNTVSVLFEENKHQL